MVREQRARQGLSVVVLLWPRRGPLLIVTLDMHFFLNALYENSVFFGNVWLIYLQTLLEYLSVL